MEEMPGRQTMVLIVDYGVRVGKERVSRYKMQDDWQRQLYKLMVKLRNGYKSGMYFNQEEYVYAFEADRST